MFFSESNCSCADRKRRRRTFDQFTIHRRACCEWRLGVVRARYRADAAGSTCLSICFHVLWKGYAHFAHLHPPFRNRNVSVRFLNATSFLQARFRTFTGRSACTKPSLGLALSFLLNLRSFSSFFQTQLWKAWSKAIESLSVPVCYLPQVT